MKLTETELNNLTFAQAGRKPNPFMADLRKLHVGESYIIHLEDWPLKTDPSTYIGGYFRRGRTNLRFQSRRLQDGSGYVVTRLEDRLAFKRKRK